ncbi:hypothetical protein [Rhizobium sp. BE258]|uniref:hypothetical protein n=1 Tax=Rhizobium sp. BE258 TaxID=2817722 RepID=UPI00285A57D5|nr:hypothetical protein [Rhizobium sp. BE258]MDR7145197.1 hypothetical protein [Rhizobium sp. BE258]
MNLKTLMLASSIAICSVTSSFAAAFPVNPTQVVDTDENNLSAVYASWVSGWSAIFNQVAGQNWTTTVYDSWGEKFLDIPEVTVLRSYSTGQPGSSFAASFIYLGGYATYTALPTPVPGPEAGAGIGALALGGIALYIQRRRKDGVAAA